MKTDAPLTVRVSGIVLAAGQSSRIGGTKQLLRFRGTTILGQVLANAGRSLLDEIIVVLGHDAPEIQRQVDLEGVKVVLNEDYQQGQSSSLKAGMNHVSNRSHAAMFLLGDQPLVDEGVINAVIRGYEKSSRPIVIPVFAGQRGNPVVIGRELFGELTAAAQGDAGARVLFNRHADVIHHVEIDSRFIHMDVDTMEDYDSLLNNSREGK
jgi:molybdenum cofactor cytidylyltransferase